MQAFDKKRASGCGFGYYGDGERWGFLFSSISVVFWFALSMSMLRLPSSVVFERVGFGADLDRFLYAGFLRLLSNGEHLLFVTALGT